ncbi:hypothetical protein AMECASPLE_035800 [Ameca splendens]|uniref:Uncharacterized protein n=1 Tax=Ameca splendens TaxID=208324 RepID=A0ABV1ADV9_9TELE
MGSWMNHLHTPILFLVLFRRGPKLSRPHTLFLSVRSLWRACLHFLFLSLRSARTHPLCMLGLGSSAADLHSLAKGPSSLCTDRLGSSGFRTAPLSSTVGSPGPATAHQISSLCTARLGSSGLRTGPPSSTVGSPDPAAGRQIISSYVVGLLSSYITGLLIAGSAGDGHWADRLNSGSAGDGFLASLLYSGSATNSLQAGHLNPCPPSEAPSAHSGQMFVLFLFCGRLGSALKGRGYVIPACVLSS